MNRLWTQSWKPLAMCMVLFGAGVLTCILLAACASQAIKPVATCRNTDWFEKGRADGLIGLPANEIESHKRQCNSTEHPVDNDLYNNGRDVGLLEYCTPAVGMQRGKESLPYLNVCPAHLEDGFLNGYKAGGKIRELEFENSLIEKRMQALTSRISRELANSILPPPSLDKNQLPRSPAGDAPSTALPEATQSALTPEQMHELQELKKKHTRIDSQIIDLESEQL